MPEWIPNDISGGVGPFQQMWVMSKLQNQGTISIRSIIALASVGQDRMFMISWVGTWE